MQVSSKKILISLIPLLTICFVSNVAPYIYIPSLPDIAKTFSISKAQVANTMSVYYLALSLSLLLTGIVGDIWDKKRMLTGASILICFGAIIAGFVPIFSTMLLGWALQAVGAGIIVVVSQAWIGQSSHKNNITVLFSYLTIILSLAPLIAPMMGGLVNELFSWQYNFYIVAVLSLFASLFMKGSMPLVPVQGNILSVKDIVKSYYQILFKSKFIGLISTSLACFVFQTSLMSYSSFLFIDQLGVKPSVYGLISVPVVIGIIIGQYPVVYLEKKRGVFSAYIFSSVIALAALLFSLLYYFIANKHTLIELALVILVFNIGFGGHNLLAIRNVMSTFTSQRSHSSSLTNFLNHFIGYLAAFLIQFLFAYINSVMQIHNIICILSILLIVATLPIFRFSYKQGGLVNL